MNAVSGSYPKHARLTYSMVRARLPKAARAILEALCYHMRPDTPTYISHARIAAWADVSEGSVSAMMPVLAAEWNNRAENNVPYLRRRWDAQRRRYEIALLPPPEVRGWWQAEPQAEPQPAPEPESPAPEVTVCADQLSFFDLLPGSNFDPTPVAPIEPIATPREASSAGSKFDPPIFYDHDPISLANKPPAQAQPEPESQATAESPPAYQELLKRGVYAGLARRVMAARPELTVPEFEAAVQALAARGCYAQPALVAAKIFARGETVEAPAAAPAASPAPPKPVSSNAILFASVHGTIKADWLARFRRASGPTEQRQVLERFEREVLAQLPIEAA